MKLNRVFFAALVVVSVCACAPKRARTANEIEQLTTSLNDLRSLQAEQVTQMEAIRNSMRELSGRVDLLEHKQSGELSNDISEVKQDLSALKGRIPPPAIVPAEALGEDESHVDLFPAEIAQKYADSLVQIKEGKFQVAMGNLEELLDAVHGTKAAPYALFWLAMSEEGAGHNPRAVKHYAEMIGTYPKHHRTALALYRQASVLVRLGDTKAAKFTYKKLISDFPKSDEATRAKDKLKGL